MFEPLRKIFRIHPAKPRPSVPDGERVYVVGDVHGRMDLFGPLIDAIERDDREAGPAAVTVILLGDLVDRGPDSAGVVAHARALQARRHVRILAGNHEEMFLQSFDDRNTLRHFLKHGGRETLFSYGISRDLFNESTLDELQRLMREAVPAEDREFLRSFEDYVILGDYLFVHAGILPDVPIEQQSRHDLLWIRDRFLRHSATHPYMVVHGHTIFDEVDERDNRIGIDTGAFRTGRLTALVLEGHARRYIQAADQAGTITIRTMETA